MRTAVLEINTSTLRLLIVDETMRRVVDLCRFGRLEATGPLDPKAITRSLKICREYRAVMDAHAVGATRAFATKALGDATNVQDFIAPAQKIVGTRIEILTMEREADLLAVTVSRTFPELARAHYLVVDVGDRTTWIVDIVRGRVETATSVPIGAAQLTERHLRHDPPTGGEMNAVEKAIDTALKPVGLPKQVAVIGTGGIATTIAALELELPTYDPDRVAGLRILYQSMWSWTARLSRVSLAKRKRMRGLEPERASEIVGGVALYARLLTWVGAPTDLVTSDRGIRWGLAFERATPSPANPPARAGKATAAKGRSANRRRAVAR